MMPMAPWSVRLLAGAGLAVAVALLTALPPADDEPLPPRREASPERAGSPGLAQWLDRAWEAARERGAGPTPSVVARASAPHLHPGDRVRIHLEAHNPAGAPTRNLYAGVVLPDGQTALFGDGHRVTLPKQLRWLRQPSMRVDELPGGESRVSPAFFETTLTENHPPGTYRIFVVLARQGPSTRVRVADAVAVHVETVVLERRPHPP